MISKYHLQGLDQCRNVEVEFSLRILTVYAVNVIVKLTH